MFVNFLAACRAPVQVLLFLIYHAFCSLQTPNESCRLLDCVRTFDLLQCTAYRAHNLHTQCAKCNVHWLLLFAHCSLQNLFPPLGFALSATPAFCTCFAFYTFHKVPQAFESFDIVKFVNWPQCNAQSVESSDRVEDVERATCAHEYEFCATLLMNTFFPQYPRPSIPCIRSTHTIRTRYDLCPCFSFCICIGCIECIECTIHMLCTIQKVGNVHNALIAVVCVLLVYASVMNNLDLLCLTSLLRLLLSSPRVPTTNKACILSTIFAYWMYCVHQMHSL